ncbi:MULTISPECIES: SHOCT domain-containing protein [unclassified Lacrimispora]|uniref:SHOCT domain-containing protein n=1 Tax=unclassified Lacrimispora TaxID=2719232 RepID=UPI0037706DA3
MSIKGIKEDLYIGKKEINIITFWGNKETVEYADMKRIDYKYAETLNSGYIDFIANEEKRRFKFNVKSNDKIGLAVDYIANACPELLIVCVTKKDLTKEHSVMLFIINGHKEMGLSSQRVVIKQRADGGTYFNDDNQIYYAMTGYEWEGPEYDKTISSSGQTVSNSETKKKGKALRIGAGAIVGSVFGPAGTLVGGAMGAGSKGKSRTKGATSTSSTTIEKHVENDTIAFITLENPETHEAYKLSVKCNTDIDAKLKCFKLQAREAAAGAVKTLEEIKALKDLFDMGMISESEFDERKQRTLKGM